MAVTQGPRPAEDPDHEPRSACDSGVPAGGALARGAGSAAREPAQRRGERAAFGARPRKRFGSAHFVAGDSAVLSLDLSDVELDVEDFLVQATAGLAATSEQDGRDALLDAEAAYGGDFLAEDLYADWAVGLREEARAAYVAVAKALAELELAEGRQDASARYLRRVIEREPHDEGAQLGLVSVLAAAGQHGEARRAYSAYVRKMDEIDVEAAPYPASS